MVRKIGDDVSERKVIDNIAQYGWHCMNILAEGDSPGFAFTVGTSIRINTRSSSFLDFHRMWHIKCLTLQLLD